MLSRFSRVDGAAQGLGDRRLHVRPSLPRDARPLDRTELRLKAPDRSFITGTGSTAASGMAPGDSHLRRLIDVPFYWLGRFAKVDGDLRCRQGRSENMARPVPFRPGRYRFQSQSAHHRPHIGAHRVALIGMAVEADVAASRWAPALQNARGAARPPSTKSLAALLRSPQMIAVVAEAIT
jgi:hypothetical protein